MMNVAKANAAAATAVLVVAKLVRISVHRKMGRANLSEKFLPKFIDKHLFNKGDSNDPIPHP